MTSSGGYEGEDPSTTERTEDLLQQAKEREERFAQEKADRTDPDARMDQGSTPEARAAEHARELAEFQAWRRSRMDPTERKAEELEERFKRYEFDQTTAEFWELTARELIQGAEYHEIAQSFKKVTTIFEALRANLDTFNRKIKRAFEEDADREEE